MTGPFAKGAAAVLLLAAITGAQADDPSAPVREAYRLERESLDQHWTSGRKPPWRAPHRDKLFSKRFAELWATDERYSEATNDIGNIDADPFIAAQDHEADVLHDLVIDVVKQRSNRAEVRARFTNLGPVTVRFVVIRERGRWVIDDILNTEDGTVYSAAKALAQPYACSEAWKERCERSLSERPAVRGSERSVITVGDLLSGASFGLRSLTVERARTLGKVVREVVEKLPRDWSYGNGELHTVVLDGLELEFAVPRGRQSFLTSATITSPSWSLPGGIAVGVPFERVRRALGEGRREGNVVRYVGDEAPECAEFTVQHDTVVRVKLIPYTG